jgi:hypothetical protein
MVRAADLERRDFFRSALGLGVVAVATSFGPGASAEAASSDELPRPKGLRTKAMLDCRFPVSYEVSVPTAMQVLVRYFTALANRDLAAIAATLHFPFAIYEGIHPLIYKTQAEFMASPPPSMNFSGRLQRSLLDRKLQGHGGLSILPGSFDMLDKLQLHTFNPVNVGLELVFSRYQANGEKLERCEGIYGVTNNDGRWAIQMMSTIFTPANPGNQLDVQYADAREQALRASRDWMLGWANSDPKLLSARRGAPGLQASIAGGTNARPAGGAGYYMAEQRNDASGGGGPYSSNFMNSAQLDQPMSIYGSKGVKSRLRVSEGRRADGIEGPSADYSEKRFEQFNKSAAGGMGLYGYTLVLPDQRILHACVDKAHSYGGYIRYTPESIMISETRSLGIQTYENQEWRSAGGFGQSIYRDCTNDQPD